jgi:RimJ/RimL family protein N-acetyltransferase
MISEIPTDRLFLRAWRDTDREPFAALNADPRVIEHFPSTLSREQSDALANHVEAQFDRHGFGFWAVEVPSVAPFVGFIGLSVPPFDTHFTVCRERSVNAAGESPAQGGVGTSW